MKKWHKNQFVIIPIVAAILLLMVFVSLTTPLLLNMVTTTTQSVNDSAALQMALNGIELANKEQLATNADVTLNLGTEGTCRIKILPDDRFGGAWMVDSLATVGTTSRRLIEPYTPSVIGDVVFAPIEVTESTGSPIADNSGYSNNAAPNNVAVSSTTHPRSGSSVNTLNFNSNTSRLVTPSSESLQLTTEGGIAFWYKMPQGSNSIPIDEYILIMRKGEKTGEDADYRIIIRNFQASNSYRMQLYPGRQANNAIPFIWTTSNSVVGNERFNWHHFAFCWDAAGMRAYIDGKLNIQTPYPNISSPVSSGNVYWGNKVFNSSLPGEFAPHFRGSIYQPIIMKRSFKVDAGATNFKSTEVESLYEDRRLYYAMNGVGTASYPANDNETATGKALDQTIWVNHGELNGSPNTAAQNSTNTVNKAYGFNAASQQYVSDSKVFLELRNAFTVIGAVNLTNYTSKMTLTQFGDHFKIDLTPTAAGYNVTFTSTALNLTLSGALTSKTGWHRIAVTSTGTLARLYIDSAIVASANLNNSSFSASTVKPLRVAASLASSEYYNGTLDEFAIYGRALSSTELLKPYIHFTFQEGSGNSTDDIVGSNDGTLSNTSWSTRTAPNASKVLYFNGSTSQVTTPSFKISQQLTICCWIRPDSLSGDRALVAQNNVFAFKTHGNGLRFTTPNIRDHNSSNIVLNQPNWQHVAVVFTAGQAGGCRFYYNGVYKSASNASGMNTPSRPLRIGINQWPNQQYLGRIDGVRVYKRALTDAEILDVYNAGD